MPLYRFKTSTLGSVLNNSPQRYQDNDDPFKSAMNLIETSV